MPYRITQGNLPHGRCGIAAFTPAKAGTRFRDSEGCKAELTLGHRSRVVSVPTSLAAYSGLYSAAGTACDRYS